MRENREFDSIEEAMDTGDDILTPEESFSLKKAMKDLCRTVCAFTALFLIITSLFKPALTRGDSMAPTLLDGDRTVISVMGYQPRRGDVVVLQDPGEAGKHLVKRVIATGGEQVDIDFDLGVVYVNGLALEEPYCSGPTHAAYDVEFPVVVPEGHLFVMGDNRDFSHDSRSADVGMIPVESIEGRVIWRFYPFDRMGVIH